MTMKFIFISMIKFFSYNIICAVSYHWVSLILPALHTNTAYFQFVMGDEESPLLSYF